MTAPYFLKQAGREVVPGSGGRHRLNTNRSRPPAHAASSPDGVEVGKPEGVEIGYWPSRLSWRALIGHRG